MGIDIQTKISSMLRRLALALTLAAGSSMVSAGVIKVAIDTAGFGAGSGYLDMQFSASSGGVPLASAEVRNMVGFGSIDLNFGVTPVAGGFQLRNDLSNYLSHAVNFGGVLSFDLSIAGQYDPDPRSMYFSHFVVTAFDQAFTALGAQDPASGALADFSWRPMGIIGIDLVAPYVTVVPEPADWLLMGAGLTAMALVLRRRAAGKARQHRAA